MGVLSIADAVVTALNARSWKMGFTATRALRPIYELSDLSAVQIAVVPKAVERERLSRAAVQKNTTIDIGVLKRTASAAEYDTLIELCEEIADYFPGVSLDGHFCQKTIYDPIYHPEHVEELNQFTGLVSLEIKGV